MTNIASLRDMSEFSQAVESYSKDRDALVSLKGLLEQQLLDIKGQLMGLNAADGPQLDHDEAQGVRGRIHRAETAKSYVVRRMQKVDSVLARLQREGGWLLWVEGWKHGWVATKVPPAEWLLQELETHGDGAREIGFSVPITQDQWSRIPKDAAQFYEP